jgi:EpsI family protein
MLSIVYGGDQSDNGMQAHLPEYCYAAQGFQLRQGRAAQVDTRYGRIPVTRLETEQGQCVEPVTYWITIGDTVYHTAFEKRWREVEYRLKGYIPYGLVFRVSSIDPDAIHAFVTQAAFISVFVNVLDAPARQRIAGITAPVTTP